MTISMYTTGIWTPLAFVVARFVYSPATRPVSAWSPDNAEVIAAKIAPLPSVAMKELTRRTVTTNAFTPPITTHAAIVTTPASAGLMLVCWSRYATKIPANARVAPIERSYTPAASGTTSERATSPVIAYWLRIDFAVSSVGNVDGEMIEKRITIRIQT